jgi:hypothetical protein
MSKFAETFRAYTVCYADHFGIKLSNVRLCFDEHIGEII